MYFIQELAPISRPKTHNIKSTHKRQAIPIVLNNNAYDMIPPRSSYIILGRFAALEEPVKNTNLAHDNCGINTGANSRLDYGMAPGPQNDPCHA